MIARALLVVGFLLVTGCVPKQQPDSTWGPVFALAQAEQSHGPALWANTSHVTAAWVGADQTGVHQDVRMLAGNLLSETSALPLPPVHPYAQSLYPAAADSLHLLWLDADSGDTRLFAALVSPALTLESGPNTISGGETLNYAAVPAGDGSLWAVWTGGPPGEPALYARRIDSIGRPAADIMTLAHDADWPALAWTTAGTRHLIWRCASSGELYHSILRDDGLSHITPTGIAVSAEPGDRLHSLYAAVDRTHIYALWNITRASGAEQVWFTTSAIDGGRWQAPQRLGVESEQTETAVETGFNTGPARAAHAGDDWLRWAAPLSGQHDVLPIVAQSGTGLTVIYMRAGQIIGYQITVPQVKIIGPAHLASDANRHLYIAWAEPEDNGPATLRLTTTRRS